jgi:hypothetical protein
MPLFADRTWHSGLAHLPSHRLRKGPVSRTLTIMQEYGLIAIGPTRTMAARI